jgi:ABC-2 type transport system ATP-binding protein
METLRSVSSGTITIGGINVAKQPNKIKQIIGVQLQNSNFYDKITLQESLKLFASFYNRKIKPTDLLKKVDLESKAKAYRDCYPFYKFLTILLKSYQATNRFFFLE